MSEPIMNKRPAPPGSIEFELTDLQDARLALEALPEGIERLPQLASNYWEQRRRRSLASDRALQGSTIEWLLKLPPSLRPRELCDRYPRAANAVAAAWKDADERVAVLDEMLSDRRGNRRGFPAEVTSELKALRYAAGHP
jgi:hypothetical protein